MLRLSQRANHHECPSILKTVKTVQNGCEEGRDTLVVVVFQPSGVVSSQTLPLQRRTLVSLLLLGARGRSRGGPPNVTGRQRLEPNQIIMNYCTYT